jgi:hypothetical protein
VTEARALDLLEVLDDAGRPNSRMTRPRFGLAARQVAGGVAVTVRAEDGRLCLVAGLYPEDGADSAELWFAAGPGLKDNLVAALRAGAKALQAVGEAAAPLTVKAYVRPGRVAGERLARWLRLGDEGVIDTELGPLSVFTRRFEHGR